MTSRLYTREEMVEAFIAGVDFWCYDADRSGAPSAPQAAESYVDGLQNPPPVPANAAPVGLIPGMVSEDALTLLVAYKADLEEFKLKTKEREVAIVKALVRITMESMLRFQYRPVERVENGILWVDHENAFADSFDWMTSHLKTYFHELTEGAV